ncbi:hypothetical protein C3L33_03983, partial [Rhododendron williamsianum]
MGWMSRFIAVVAFLAIGVIFSPETFGSTSSSSDGLQPPKLSTYLKLAHLLCFSTAFGAALWVTFIGGIIMFKYSYYTHSQFALLLESTEASVWESSKQDVPGLLRYGWGLLCCMCDVFRMMKQRHKVEREEQIGEEVGWSKNVEVAKVNPKLKAMNKKFGMIHGLSSLANIMAFGSLAVHSWYLAGKMNL